MNTRRARVKRRAIAVLALVGLIIGGAQTLAHHIEVNEFDRRRPVTLTGEVVKLLWMNPHPWIHINVAGDDGQTHEWMVEAAAPKNLLRRGFSPDSVSPGTVITVDGYQNLLRRGFSPDSVSPGTVITVDGYQSRDGALRANGKTLTYADGRQFYIGYLGLLGTGD